MGTLHELLELSPPQRDTGGADAGFGVISWVLWLFAVARVSAAIAAHEIFGAEASLAVACMLALPWWALRSWLRRRAGRGRVQRRRAGEVVPFGSRVRARTGCGSGR